MRLSDFIGLIVALIGAVEAFTSLRALNVPRLAHRALEMAGSFQDRMRKAQEAKAGAFEGQRANQEATPYPKMMPTYVLDSGAPFSDDMYDHLNTVITTQPKLMKGDGTVSAEAFNKLAVSAHAIIMDVRSGGAADVMPSSASTVVSRKPEFDGGSDPLPRSSRASLLGMCPRWRA